MRKFSFFLRPYREAALFLGPNKEFSHELYILDVAELKPH
jgi:hypothetical protein